MSMHARTVAAAASVPTADISEVVRRMVAARAIHQEGARAALLELRLERPLEDRLAGVLAVGEASGTVVLLGEHAVVHGYPALASSLDRGVRVEIRRRAGPVWIEAPALLTAGPLFDDGQAPLKVALRRVFALLEAPREGLALHITGELPPGKGVGSSAALAIAALRAVSRALDWTLEEPQLLEYAHQVEQIFHGLPSGIDHTTAARGGVLRFERGDPPVIEPVTCPQPFSIVLLDSGEVGPTAVQVGRVLGLLEQHPERVRGIFDEIGTLVAEGVRAMSTGDGEALARAMNRNHVLLQALEVSTPRQDQLVALARQAGAAGAKLTGSGGGGMVVALCLEGSEGVLAAAAERGVTAFAARVPAGIEQPTVGDAAI